MSCCHNRDVHLGLAGGLSKVALLRLRSLQPRRGLFQDAFLKRIAREKNTSLSLVARFKKPAVYITDGLFLVGRSVVRLRPGISNEILCLIPCSISLNRSPPTFLIQQEPCWNTSQGWHPMLYGLMKLCGKLARVDLITGSYQCVTLPRSVRFASLSWATYDKRIVAASCNSDGPASALGLAVFNVEPFRLVCTLQLCRSGALQGRRLHQATVDNDLLIAEFKERKRAKATLKLFDFREVVRRFTDEKFKWLLQQSAVDVFSESILREDGLPFTTTIDCSGERMIAPLLTLSGVELDSLEIGETKPFPLLIKRRLDNRAPSKQCAALHSMLSGRIAEYGEGTGPFVSDDTFAEENATLVDMCPLLLHQSSDCVSVLRYSSTPGGVDLRVTPCYDIHVDDSVGAGEHRPANVSDDVYTSSGRLVKRLVSVNEFEESLVNSLYCDPDLGFLVITLASRQSPGTGSVCFYDLHTGVLLKKLALENWKEGGHHNAMLFKDTLVHVHSSGSLTQTDVYLLAKPALDL
eukprot:scpid52921/ scgid10518/ 